MNVGKLKHRVEFYEETGERNHYGERISVWTLRYTRFASIEPLLGRELFAAETVQSKVEVKVRCRYFEGPTVNMQIRHGAKKYHIESAVPVEENGREWLFYCSRVVND